MRPATQPQVATLLRIPDDRLTRVDALLTPGEPHTCESDDDRKILELEEQNEALESRLRAAEEAVETLPPFDANDGDAYSIAPRIANAGAELGAARARIAELEAENAALTARRDELLLTVRRVDEGARS